MAQPWLSCLLLPALVVSVAANVAPKFLPNMTVVILPEDLPLDAEAFWLVAEDQDNDPLTYGISGSNAHFFNVTANTGQVRLASPLDFEVKGRDGEPAWEWGRGPWPVLPPAGCHLGPLLSARCRHSTHSASPSP
nr:cadherin-related family member 2-like isoform X1 [Microcebus murinus]